MIFIALVLYLIASVLLTTIICAIIGSFNIIKDEKDQERAFIIILIVVFVLSIITESSNSTIEYIFKTY